MRKLVYDFVQRSDAPDSLKTPDLSDTYDTSSFVITLSDPYALYGREFTERVLENETQRILEDGTTIRVLEGNYEKIDCIGIGNTDATQVTVNGEVITLGVTNNKNGLYLLDAPFYGNVLTVSHNGTYLGRFAAGISRFFGAAPAREPGFYSTASPRVTAAGNLIAGAGGISGRRIGLDFRYKIDSVIFDDIEKAYPDQISKGYPFFIYFDKETARMPWERLYASTDTELLFQSSINRFLYSRRFDYSERF